MNVLVIEPSRVQQIILKALFMESGISPDFVNNVDAAVQAIALEQFSYIFTGYSLPDGNGLDIAHHIKDKGLAHPKVVLLTAEEKRTIISEAITAGVQRVINRSNTRELQIFIQEIADTIDITKTAGRVLCVEDDKALAQLTKAMIEAAGSQCDISSSGEQAVQRIDEYNYDLILCDYILDNKMTGLDVVKYVRGLKSRKARIPILVMSSQSSVERKIEILQHGANDYVSKPVIEEELKVRALNLLTQKKLFDQVEEQRERLREMAMTDQLTTLYNRHFLVQFAPKQLSEANRHRYPLSLLMIDLDHFKAINDTYGHETGDQVLREVADLLKSVCRKEDTAIRMGGEEFLILLSHCDAENAKKKAEELRKQLENIKPAGLHVTTSIGVTSLATNTGTDFSTLFGAADSAVYEAKQQGRNCVVYRAPQE